MLITRNDAIAVLNLMGYVMSSTWTDAKIETKLSRADSLVGQDKVKEGSPERVTLDLVLASILDKQPIKLGDITSIDGATRPVTKVTEEQVGPAHSSPALDATDVAPPATLTKYQKAKAAKAAREAAALPEPEPEPEVEVEAPAAAPKRKTKAQAAADVAAANAEQPNTEAAPEAPAAAAAPATKRKAKAKAEPGTDTMGRTLNVSDKRSRGWWAGYVVASARDDNNRPSEDKITKEMVDVVNKHYIDNGGQAHDASSRWYISLVTQALRGYFQAIEDDKERRSGNRNANS